MHGEDCSKCGQNISAYVGAVIFTSLRIDEREEEREGERERERERERELKRHRQRQRLTVADRQLD